MITYHAITILQTKAGYFFAVCPGCTWESVAYADKATAKRVGEYHLDEFGRWLETVRVEANAEVLRDAAPGFNDA